MAKLNHEKRKQADNVSATERRLRERKILSTSFTQHPDRIPVLRELKVYTGTNSFLLSLKKKIGLGSLLTDKQVEAARRVLSEGMCESAAVDSNPPKNSRPEG